MDDKLRRLELAAKTGERSAVRAYNTELIRLGNVPTIRASKGTVYHGLAYASYTLSGRCNSCLNFHTTARFIDEAQKRYSLCPTCAPLYESGRAVLHTFLNVLTFCRGANDFSKSANPQLGSPTCRLCIKSMSTGLYTVRPELLMANGPFPAKPGFYVERSNGLFSVP